MTAKEIIELVVEMIEMQRENIKKYGYIIGETKILERKLHAAAKKYLRNTNGNYELEWHPYPQEKPPKEGKEYLITWDNGDRTGVFVSLYLRKRFSSCFDNERVKVIAWAEKPEPYKEER